MCYNAILPITIKSSNADAFLFRLTHILNRWRKMIQKYGKLDINNLADDCNIISKAIKSENLKNNIRNAIRRCRDLALSANMSLNSLGKSLDYTLKLLCEAQEDRNIKEIKQNYADQGMTERYRPLSKRLKKEKIRRIGKNITLTDSENDKPYIRRFVRRFVEKRAAQTVFKVSGKKDRHTNRFRQSVRRAVSFSLYNASFTDFEFEKRFNGTHWKVVYYPAKKTKLLKAKKSYNSFEDATFAAENYMRLHPEDSRVMQAYKCAHCDKWHIGHGAQELSIEDNIQQVG